MISEAIKGGILPLLTQIPTLLKMLLEADQSRYLASADAIGRIDTNASEDVIGSDQSRYPASADAIGRIDTNASEDVIGSVGIEGDYGL